MNAVTVLSTGHTGVTVSDLDRSVRFYRDVLGFELSPPVQVNGPFFEKVTGVPGCVIDVAFAALSEIQTATEGPARGLQVVYIRDPDGVVLELIEEPPGLSGLSLESLYFPKD